MQNYTAELHVEIYKRKIWQNLTKLENLKNLKKRKIWQKNKKKKYKKSPNRSGKHFVFARSNVSCLQCSFGNDSKLSENCLESFFFWYARFRMYDIVVKASEPSMLLRTLVIWLWMLAFEKKFSFNSFKRNAIVQRKCWNYWKATTFTNKFIWI